MPNKKRPKLGFLLLLGFFLFTSVLFAAPAMASTDGTAPAKAGFHFNIQGITAWCNQMANATGQTIDTLKAKFKGSKTANTKKTPPTADELQKMQADREAKLNDMLSSGKITQAQYDQMKIREVIDKAIRAKTTAAKDELSKLTGSDRQAKMKELRNQALNELLSAGTITQAQFDQCSEKRAMSPKNGPRDGNFDPNARMSQLLKDGKITQADYDAQLALETKMAQYRDEMKDLSPADRQAKMKDLRNQALNELLAAGTITQAQFDQLSKAPGPGGMGGPGKGGPGQGRHPGNKATN